MRMCVVRFVECNVIVMFDENIGFRNLLVLFSNV